LSNRISANVDLRQWRQFASGQVTPTYRGQTAIFHLCEHFGLGDSDEVLVPAYNCGSELEALLYRGIQAIPYRVGRNARLDFEDLQRKVTQRTRAIYVIHYFGWPQDMEPIQEFCRQKRIILLEDCALTLFSEYKGRPLGTIGDASIFSLRKFFPIPDGGVLLVNSPHKAASIDLVAPPSSATWKEIRPLVKRRMSHAVAKMGLYGHKQRLKFRITKPFVCDRQEPALPLMRKSKYYDPHKTNWAMSRHSASILHRADPAAVVQSRRENYQRLESNLSDIQNMVPLYDDLPKGVCPLYLPVIVQHRPKWVEALLRYGVSVYPFWRSYHPGMQWECFDDAQFLKNHVLTLPVHQQLTASDMDTIAEIVELVQRRVIA
jgi:dTDP-4-amino-4,6-dideoxygalactose transaminase